ncbi:MAG: serine hydrolase [Acidobacteriota bacterium]
MRRVEQKAITLLFICLAGIYANGQKIPKGGEIKMPAGYMPLAIENSIELQTILNDSIAKVLNAFPARGFKVDDIAATLIDVRDPSQLRWANFSGERQIYPASVVKMFYMTALERQLEDGKLKLTPELERGLRDMIVDSSNEATQYILDVLTDTSSGAEIPQKEFEKWQFKRNRVNRFFTAMGYQNINVNQKTFCEDAYGIEQQSRAYKGQNRNMLTTNAVARLLAEIVLGKMNTPERTAKMMELMRRDPFSADGGPEDQAHAFTGRLFIERKMTSAKLWSKAGSTNRSWHDAVYIEMPNGLKFVIVIFTENHANDKNVIPSIVGNIIDQLSRN